LRRSQLDDNAVRPFIERGIEVLGVGPEGMRLVAPVGELPVHPDAQTGTAGGEELHPRPLGNAKVAVRQPYAVLRRWPRTQARLGAAPEDRLPARRLDFGLLGKVRREALG